MAPSGHDLVRLATLGVEQPPGEVRALEAALRRDPTDVESRARLVGHHAVHAPGRASHRRHALWFIEHRPADPLTGTPYVFLRRALDPRGYRAGRRLWLDHLRRTPPVQVLANAARALAHEDPRLELALLRRGVRAEPRNPRWHSALGHHFLRRALRARGRGRRQLGREALRHLEREQRLTRGQLFRWYNLGDLAWAAYLAEQLPRATGYARRMLALVERFPGDWNRGNALHHGHTVLGLVSLEGGDVGGAGARLLEAGATPGSPQLDAFGPRLELARALLREGQAEVVLEYLERCKRFWRLSSGNLERWRKEIQGRGTSTLLPTFPRRQSPEPSLEAR